jgi:hypothetical protein
MKKDSGGMGQLRSEIKALRQQIVELKEIEHRCRQAEAALMACEKRNHLLGDSATLGIFTTDSHGNSFSIIWVTVVVRLTDKPQHFYH